MFPSNANNNECARHLYYLGEISHDYHVIMSHVISNVCRSYQSCSVGLLRCLQESAPSIKNIYTKVGHYFDAR